MHENGTKSGQVYFKIYSTFVKINLTGDAPVGKFFVSDYTISEPEFAVWAVVGSRRFRMFLKILAG